MLPQLKSTGAATSQQPHRKIENPYRKSKRPRPNPIVNLQKAGSGQFTSTTPSVYQASNSNEPALLSSNTHPNENYSRLSSGSNQQATSSATSNTSAPAVERQPPKLSNPKKRDSLDSFEDSFDWDEAIRVTDNAIAYSQSAHSSSSSQVDNNNVFKEVTTQTNEGFAYTEVRTFRPPEGTGKPTLITTTHSSARKDNVYRSDGVENDVVGQQQSAPCSANNSAKPPPLLDSGTTNRHSMASLRPKEWSHQTSASPALSQQLITKQGQAVPSPAPHQHPLIARLPVELRFSPEAVQPVNDDYKKELIKHANLSKPLANGWTLFDHQKKAILKALLMRRFILALDMGLGKTLVGCVWIRSFQKAFEDCKAIVICPVSLKQEWSRTAVQATELNVAEEETKSKKKKQEVIDNHTAANVEIFSWAKVPTTVDDSAKHYVVVCDEAHSIQSMQAARTKDLLALVKPKRCVGVLMLTGTPMKNGKPSNLFPLLKAVRHPFGNHQRAYETQFCNGRQKNFGRGEVWDASGSSNLEQLRELSSSHLLHLTKDECLKQLPKATRVHKHIPVSHRLTVEYGKALQDMQRLYTMSTTNSMDNGEALLGALQQVRFVGSLAKIDATVEIAKEILKEEPAVVIFTSFVKVAASVHKKLEQSGWSGELLTGETPAKKRQTMVDNFQNGLTPVFVCTFGAGGVGLTLTASRTVILLDRPWTPGDASQAEDRVRRIGQRHPVKSIWVSAFDVDKHIDQMLESKTMTSNAVLNNPSGKEKTNGLPPAMPRVSVMKLIGEMLPQQPTLSFPAL